MKVDGKVVWLTGASSGIGEALAYVLAKKDAKVILSARRVDELKRVKNTCPEHAQELIKVLPFDLTEAGTIDQVTSDAIALFGGIDIVINNGGISQRSLSAETRLEVDRKLMEVNYFAPVAITKNLLPHFKAQGRGHIVNISSLVGKFGTPYRSGYAAAKHALHGFFDSLRAEVYKDNILITMICPGFIKTNVSINALTEHGEKLNEMDQAQANGMAASTCAHKIVRAIESNKQEVYIGGKEVYGVYMKRFFPQLFSRILRKAQVR